MSPARALPKRKSGALDNRHRAEPFDQPLHELGGRLGEHLRRGRHDHHLIGPGVTQPRDPLGHGGDPRRLGIGPQQPHRRRVEGDGDDRRITALAGDLPCPLQDRAVADVRAIEVAEGQDAGAAHGRQCIAR